MEIDKVKLISKLEHANLEINLTLASAVGNFNVKFIYYRHLLYIIIKKTFNSLSMK